MLKTNRRPPFVLKILGGRKQRVVAAIAQKHTKVANARVKCDYFFILHDIFVLYCNYCVSKKLVLLQVWREIRFWSSPNNAFCVSNSAASLRLCSAVLHLQCWWANFTMVEIREDGEIGMWYNRTTLNFVRKTTVNRCFETEDRFNRSNFVMH